MKERLTHRDALWGYSAQLINLAGGIFLLPLLLIHLSTDELGLWFVFLTMVSFAQLIELGLQPTLARYAAYVYSGADELHSLGLRNADAGSVVNVPLLARLVYAGRRAYRVVSCMVAFILLVGGGTYLIHLQSGNPASLYAVLPAWSAYAGGFVISAYFGYYNAFILGRGDTVQNNKIIIVSKGSFLIFGSLAVIFDHGLIGLGVSSFLSCIVSRLTARYYYFMSEHSGDKSIEQNSTAQSLMGALWPNTWRLSVVQLGAFLIVRANTLIASTFLGLAVVASYGLTLQLLLVISGIASMLVSLQLPRMNAAQIRGDREQLQRVVGLSIVSSWILFSIGAIILACFGNAILDEMGKNINMPDTVMLAAMSGIIFLEMTHSIAAMYLTTLNRVPFASAAIISGVAIVSLSTFFCGWLDMGLWGLILSQGIVQLAYNNWKWPVEAMKNLEIAPSRLVQLGIVELGRTIRAK